MTQPRTLVWLTVAASVVGCGRATAPVPPPTTEPPPRREQGEVTLHVPGMNRELKILGGDGPNKVKQALSELPGVERVEDEWERDLNTGEDLDLLFVKYDPDKVTVAELMKTIKGHGFEPAVKR